MFGEKVRVFNIVLFYNPKNIREFFFWPFMWVKAVFFVTLVMLLAKIAVFRVEMKWCIKNRSLDLERFTN